MTLSDPLAPVRLLLDTLEAAFALGVCQKTLWSLTVPRGPIPCVRIGRRVASTPTTPPRVTFAK